jgi:acyl-CoA synthetase (AMP-forming)/AMP-acid ligase II
MIRSPHDDVHIPDIGLTQFVMQHASRLGDKTAVVCAVTRQSYSYTQLAHAIDRASAGFHKCGVRKGHVVGIVSANAPDFTVAFLALAAIGAVVSTVNPNSTAAEIARQFNDSSAMMLVTSEAMFDKCAEVKQQVPTVRQIVVLGECAGATPFSALLNCTDAPPHVSIDARNDLVALPYSSGTAGLPKGVMLTHRNLVANLCQTFGPGAALGETDRILAVLPFYHIYGLVTIMNGALSVGATLVTLPKFDFELFLETIESQRITYINVVPPILLSLAKHASVDRFDLRTLQHVHCGAAPLGEELAAACSERLGAVVRQGYGLTETSPVTHTHPHSGVVAKYGSVGPPVANTECRIVHLETSEDVARGERGELWVRGPQVMRGYLHNKVATDQVLTAEGWFRTGDVAVADEEGWFTIVDRVKELIKYNGMQVAPAELEALLLSHRHIADAAVIPVADEVAGQIPKAFIVPRSAITAEEVIAFVAERVAPYKKVRAVEFVDSIPRSPSGKILRRVLVDREQSHPSVPFIAPTPPHSLQPITG